MKGFTLIEFVVIISIFAIMAAVVLFNFTSFKSNIALNNLSHDVALTIRQAQVFGWGTRSGQVSEQLELDPVTGNPIRFAQGVYFSYGNDVAGAFDKSFKLYSKYPNDSRPGFEGFDPRDTITDTIKIQGVAYISAICTATAITGDVESLAITPGTHAFDCRQSALSDGVSIAFSRPRPEAMFFSGNAQPLDPSVQYVAIYVSASNDPVGTARHVIIVSRLGEIAVH